MGGESVNQPSYKIVLKRLMSHRIPEWYVGMRRRRDFFFPETDIYTDLETIGYS